MPKKFQGENSKAATARARKAEAKAVADARKKKEEDDALWQETDKHVLKKEQRKVSCLSSVVLCSAKNRYLAVQNTADTLNQILHIAPNKIIPLVILTISYAT